MCRSREGRIHEYLRETALNNAKYLTVFQNTSDAELYAGLMFPLTGDRPASLETDQNRWRFMDLDKRQMVMWDKAVRRPQFWETPNVDIPAISFNQLMEFEGEHMRRIGRSVDAIRQEVSDRQAKIQAMMPEGKPATLRQTPRQFPKNQMGRKA